MNRTAPGFPRIGRLIILASLAAGLSCSKTAPSTYVDVHVTIDNLTVSRDQLALVTSCEVQVMSVDLPQPFTLPCRENNVPYDVGTFEWVSQAKSGTLQFLVRILDASRVIVGQVTSDALPVSPGKHLQTTVLVLGVLPSGSSDGGGDTGGDTLDGGTDLPPSTDGSTADVGGDGLPSADLAPDSALIDASPDLAAADATTDAASEATADGGAPDRAATDATGGADVTPPLDTSTDTATADGGAG